MKRTVIEIHHEVEMSQEMFVRLYLLWNLIGNLVEEKMDQQPFWLIKTVSGTKSPAIHAFPGVCLVRHTGVSFSPTYDASKLIRVVSQEREPLLVSLNGTDYYGKEEPGEIARLIKHDLDQELQQWARRNCLGPSNAELAT